MDNTINQINNSFLEEIYDTTLSMFKFCKKNDDLNKENKLKFEINSQMIKTFDLSQFKNNHYWFLYKNDILSLLRAIKDWVVQDYLSKKDYYENKNDRSKKSLIINKLDNFKSSTEWIVNYFWSDNELNQIVKKNESPLDSED